MCPQECTRWSHVSGTRVSVVSARQHAATITENGAGGRRNLGLHFRKVSTRSRQSLGRQLTFAVMGGCGLQSCSCHRLWTLQSFSCSLQVPAGISSRSSELFQHVGPRSLHAFPKCLLTITRRNCPGLPEDLAFEPMIVCPYFKVSAVLFALAPNVSTVCLSPIESFFFVWCLVSCVAFFVCFVSSCHVSRCPLCRLLLSCRDFSSLHVVSDVNYDVMSTRRAQVCTTVR